MSSTPATALCWWVSRTSPARDELLTREHQQGLAAAIPASRLVVYEDTGHLVLWEQPERVAADLTAFVESLHQRLA
jgi:pimeloyl-ACP methyl ester carboxylesterase